MLNMLNKYVKESQAFLEEGFPALRIYFSGGLLIEIHKEIYWFTKKLICFFITLTHEVKRKCSVFLIVFIVLPCYWSLSSAFLPLTALVCSLVAVVYSSAHSVCLLVVSVCPLVYSSSHSFSHLQYPQCHLSIFPRYTTQDKTIFSLLQLRRVF